MGKVGWDMSVPPTPESMTSGMRAFMEVMVDPELPEYKKYIEMTDVELVSGVGGPDFHPGAAVIDVYVQKVKKNGKTNQPCLLYFHGGGAIAGTAKQGIALSSRYAVEADCTIVNVDYRLAPEAKAPAGIHDSYAALKWVLANAEKLGIDKNRVGMYGESGGGYICAGVAMCLAMAGEGALVKYQV